VCDGRLPWEYVFDVGARPGCRQVLIEVMLEGRFDGRFDGRAGRIRFHDGLV
jgi:hypothetical protein